MSVKAMNNPTQTPFEVPRKVAGPSIAPARVGKQQQLVTLSAKLNLCKNSPAVVREAVDGLTAILEASGGLMMLLPPEDLLYTKYVRHSDALAALERTLKDHQWPALPISSAPSGVRVQYVGGLLIVPLHRDERSVGLIAFDTHGRALAANHEAGLLLLCNHLVALLASPKNAPPRSVDADDMASAAVLQQNLLPAIPPSHSSGLAIATHAQTAGFVSGDYFDLIRIDDGKMGVVIADVEGKGVSAALFGNMLRTTVHFLTRESSSTASVLGKVNAILHKEAAAMQKLFTLFYAVYNQDTKELTYTGSGHVSPVVVRAADRKVERLHSDGTLIGIKPEQTFRERAVQLQPGDTLALFTDGLIEYANGKGEVFGEHRLIQVMQERCNEPVERIMKSVLSELARFSPSPPADDLTLILAKVVEGTA